MLTSKTRSGHSCWFNVLCLEVCPLLIKGPLCWRLLTQLMADMNGPFGCLWPVAIIESRHSAFEGVEGAGH